MTQVWRLTILVHKSLFLLSELFTQLLIRAEVQFAEYVLLQSAPDDSEHESLTACNVDEKLVPAVFAVKEMISKPALAVRTDIRFEVFQHVFSWFQSVKIYLGYSPEHSLPFVIRADVLR